MCHRDYRCNLAVRGQPPAWGCGCTALAELHANSADGGHAATLAGLDYADTPPAYQPTASATPSAARAAPSAQHYPPGPAPDAIFGPAITGTPPTITGPKPPALPSPGASSTAPQLAPSGGCSGSTPGVSNDLDPSWDFLTNYITVSPAGGCVPTNYYYAVSWNGAPLTYFAPDQRYSGVRTDNFAWLDTSTHTGYAQVAAAACDSGGCSNFAFTPTFTLQAHDVQLCGNTC